MRKRIPTPLKFALYLTLGLLVGLLALIVCVPWEIYKWCRGFPKALEDAYEAFEASENQIYPD